MKEVALVFLGIAILATSLFGGINALSNAQCATMTADIGYSHRYSFMAGCQIEIEGGRWIPLDAYYYQERP